MLNISKHYLARNYGAPFVKILYLTDLAQKLLSLHIFSYLCMHLYISAQRYIVYGAIVDFSSRYVR